MIPVSPHAATAWCGCARAGSRPPRRRRSEPMTVQTSVNQDSPVQAHGRVPLGRVPLWLKLLFSAHLAVLVPVYWYYYGPTNFLYFCDVALILTLVGLWIESPLLISMCAVGIVLPQI